MIRLLVLTDTNIGGRAGAEQHLLNLVERLDYTAFQVRILQLAPTVPSAEGSVAGATYSHLPTGRLLSWNGLQRVARVYQHLRGGYDCVFSLFETSDLLAATLGPLAGVRARVSSRRDTGFRHSPRMRQAYRMINRSFHTVVAASEAIRVSLLDEGVAPAAIRVIHNGVDVARFGRADGTSVRLALGIPAGDGVLGMIANLSPVKNHASVIRCLAALRAEGAPLHLVLAGDGPLRPDLERQVAQAGLDEWVHFLGRRKDVPEILEAVDVVVSASRTEGLSNALLEASAAARPIVATRVGGNPEVVEDEVTGLLVPVEDDAALTAALRRLIGAPDLRERMGWAGRERVGRDFSLEAMVRQYVEVFEGAIGGARR